MSIFDGPRRVLSAYARARGIVVDLDGAPLTAATQLALPPSLIVRTSPGKFHAYWLIADFETETVPAAELKGMMQTAARLTGGDTQITDVARAMRLPGFYHMKPNADGVVTPHKCVVEMNRDVRYPLHALRKLFPIDAKRPTARTKGEDGRTSPEHLAEALAALDPHEFRDYDSWFALLCACHHATRGKGRDVFFDWCAGDERYRGRRNDNGQMWRGVETRGYGGALTTVGTLVHELRSRDLHYQADLIRFGWCLYLVADSDSPPAWVAECLARDEGRGLSGNDEGPVAGGIERYRPTRASAPIAPYTPAVAAPSIIRFGE